MHHDGWGGGGGGQSACRKRWEKVRLLHLTTAQFEPKNWYLSLKSSDGDGAVKDSIFEALSRIRNNCNLRTILRELVEKISFDYS